MNPKIGKDIGFIFGSRFELNQEVLTEMDELILATLAGIMKINLIKYAKFANNSFEMI